MKIENWNNHDIRFIEKDGQWWAVAKDVADALGYMNHNKAIGDHVDTEDKGVTKRDTLGGQQTMTIINEYGVYSLIMSSKLKSAKQFKRWVFEVIKTLRQASGLEGFQIFRQLDKEHQKNAMDRLKEGLKEPTKKHYIKANTIADKAVSSVYGHPKMLKKHEMTPEMLNTREPILDKTVELMSVKEEHGLDISVSKTMYKWTENNFKVV